MLSKEISVSCTNEKKKSSFFFWNAVLERYLPRWIFVINVLTAMTFWLSASSTKVMWENQLFEIKCDNFFLLW